jgi:hypothetical protein
MTYIAYLISSIRERFPVNRVVAILTPFLVTAAGAVSVWLTQNVEFISKYVDQKDVEGVFIAAAAAALAAAYKWLDGWQKHEERVAYESDSFALDYEGEYKGEPADELELAQADKPKKVTTAKKRTKRSA